MFESVKQEDRCGGITYLVSLLVSVVVHAVILCMLMVVPLIFFNVLQAQDVLTFLAEPPPPPAQPPPPSPPARASAFVGRPEIISYDAPCRIPDGIPHLDSADEAPFDPAGMIAAIPGIGGDGQTEGAGKGIVEILRQPVIIQDPPKPREKPRAPVRVGMLEQSKLIYRVNPVYPAIAVKARVMGTVILEAVVDEEGAISTLMVLSGHPFLVDAAVQAVKQWKYSPTVLSGEPVPIIAAITVVFRLD
jgi:protein TonB